jgi:lysophospholipase L1-like esterase
VNGLAGLAPKVLLGPLLIWQGRRVRRQALVLPEAAGPRQGCAGHGPQRLSLLLLGDSAAAGVGAPDQAQALAEPLAQALAALLGGSVRWQLLARTGHTAADALQALALAVDQGRLTPADLLLTCLGVNDVVDQTPPRRWLDSLDRIHQLARSGLGVRRSWHAGLPPMGRFPLLPQPLRWVLGRDAQGLDAALQRHLAGLSDRAWAPLPEAPAGPSLAGWMAEDGFHPGPLGYRHWAAHWAGQIASRERCEDC